MRRPVGVKGILCCFSDTRVFLPPSGHCRHASIRTLEERFVSLAFIQYAVPAVAISQIQADGQCGLRNITALLHHCGANLLHCRSHLSLVPLSTSITSERTPHPVWRPA